MLSLIILLCLTANHLEFWSVGITTKYFHAFHLSFLTNKCKCSAAYTMLCKYCILIVYNAVLNILEDQGAVGSGSSHV